MLVGVDHNATGCQHLGEGAADFLEASLSRGGEGTTATKIDEAAWSQIAKNMIYLQGDLDQAGYLRAARATSARRSTPSIRLGGNVLFYLAVADRFFGPISRAARQAGLLDGGTGRLRFRRVIIEKPFGHDLASAKALERRSC